MSNQLYPGARLGADGHYYKVAFEKNVIHPIDESLDYGGTIRALAIDDDYVYAGGFDIQRVRKYRKSDMSYVAESLDYGGTIYALAIDDDYVYAGGDTIYIVVKYKNIYGIVGYERIE